MIAALLLGAVLAQSPKSFEVKHELRLVPNAQLNGKFSEHHGTGFAYSVELRNRLSFRAGWQSNWIAERSGFTDELISKVRESPQAATVLLGQWTVHLGTELRIAEGTLWSAVPLWMNVDAGVGAMSTAVLLRALDGSDRTANTGLRISGTAGLSMNVELTRSVRILAEVRSNFWPSHLETIDGCNYRDLQEMAWAEEAGRGPGSLQLSDSCNQGAFRDGLEMAQARYLLPRQSEWESDVTSDILSILSAGVGLSYAF